MSNEELIDLLIGKGVLKSPRIIEAFLKVDRKFFVPPQSREFAYSDTPLKIASNQTISQPYTVAFMLELLEPQIGDRVLDIGSGSGWTTALLAYIVGDSGEVIGLERQKELLEFGRENLSKFHFKNASIKEAKESLGLVGEKFDKILVSAASNELPKELLDQLKVGGILVIPIGESIFKFKKIDENKIESNEFKGFRFVPLIY
jgi:protein-L-isoaspartate(D-aspartate) O-methyltransferase